MVGFHVVIPARYGATRLPGKPLLPIAGRPMIAHVHARACAAAPSSVVVATDDRRIADAVVAFGGEVAMTRADHASGTERVAEVAAQRGWPDDAIVVNLQGDEPCMPAQAVQAVVGCLARSGADLATLATPLRDPPALFSPHVVKVVVDDAGEARWFSRAPLPFVRDAFDNPARPPLALPTEVPFLRHVGLYAYRVAALRRLSQAPPHPHEMAECLEQLRALLLGLRIAVEVLPGPIPAGVDTPEDVARVAALLTA